MLLIPLLVLRPAPTLWDATEQVARAEWAQRDGSGLYGAGVAYCGGKLVLTGGKSELLSAVPVVEHGTNEVWVSASMGASWVQANASTSFNRSTFSPRFLHALWCTPKGRLVLYGGAALATSPGHGDTRVGQSDVWHSDDVGATWTRVVEFAPWGCAGGCAATGDENHFPGRTAAYVWRNGTADQLRMFAVVDREKGAGTEVWSSDDDGVSWAQRNTAPTGFNNSSVPCGGSSSAARAPGDAPMFVATASGVLYHAGGTLRSSAVANEDVCPALSDVFRSIDAGATWDRITDAAPWPPRSYGTMFALGERIYVIGGRRIPCVPSTADHSTCNFNDAWSSVDGIAWVRELPFAPWQARSKMSAEVVKYDADTGVGTVALLTGEELWYDSDTCSSFPENQCTRYAADVWLASVSQARPAGAGSGDADHLPVIDVVVCTAASLLSAVALIATVFVAALARRRCNQVAVSPHSSVGSTPAERSMLVAPFAQDFDAAQLWGVGDGDGSEEVPSALRRINAQRLACTREMVALYAKCTANVKESGVTVTTEFTPVLRNGASAVGVDEASLLTLRVDQSNKSAFLGRGRFGTVSVGWIGTNRAGDPGEYVAVKTTMVTESIELRSSSEGNLLSSGAMDEHGAGAMSMGYADMAQRRDFPEERGGGASRLAKGNRRDTELSVLRAVRMHQNIVRMRGSVRDGYVTERLVMELCAGTLSQRSLMQVMPQFRELINIDPATRLHLATGVLCGLHHLHAQDICHRDLKPNNTLISYGTPTLSNVFGFNAVLSDFGLAKTGRNDLLNGGDVSLTMTAHQGTEGWRAPELYSVDENSIDRTTMEELQIADTFSAGLILYYIFSRTTQTMRWMEKEDWNRAMRGHGGGAAPGKREREMLWLFHGFLDARQENVVGNLVGDLLLRSAGGGGGASGLGRRVSVIAAVVSGLTHRSPDSRMSVVAGMRALLFAQKSEAMKPTPSDSRVQTLIVCGTVTAAALGRSYVAGACYPNGTVCTKRLNTTMGSAQTAEEFRQLLTRFPACCRVHLVCDIAVEGSALISVLCEAAARRDAALRIVLVVGDAFTRPVLTPLFALREARRGAEDAEGGAGDGERDGERDLESADSSGAVAPPLAVVSWTCGTAARGSWGIAVGVFTCALHRFLASGSEVRRAFDAACVEVRCVSEWRGAYAEVPKVFETKFALVEPGSIPVDAHDRAMRIETADGDTEGIPPGAILVGNPSLWGA